MEQLDHSKASAHKPPRPTTLPPRYSAHEPPNKAVAYGGWRKRHVPPGVLVNGTAQFARCQPWSEPILPKRFQVAKNVANTKQLLLISEKQV